MYAQDFTNLFILMSYFRQIIDKTFYLLTVFKKYHHPQKTPLVAQRWYYVFDLYCPTFSSMGGTFDHLRSRNGSGYCLMC